MKTVKEVVVFPFLRGKLFLDMNSTAVVFASGEPRPYL
jgi:hypothetical protein